VDPFVISSVAQRRRILINFRKSIRWIFFDRLLQTGNDRIISCRIGLVPIDRKMEANNTTGPSKTDRIRGLGVVDPLPSYGELYSLFSTISFRILWSRLS
jgi:hypothetical protein